MIVLNGTVLTVRSLSFKDRQTGEVVPYTSIEILDRAPGGSLVHDFTASVDVFSGWKDLESKSISVPIKLEKKDNKAPKLVLLDKKSLPTLLKAAA